MRAAAAVLVLACAAALPGCAPVVVGAGAAGALSMSEDRRSSGAQLDDQARKFLNGPHGVRVEKDGDEVVLHVTKILDWFGDDFEQWGGGRVPFLRKYLTPDKQRQINAARGKVELEFDDYSWDLNEAQ